MNEAPSRIFKSKYTNLVRRAKEQANHHRQRREKAKSQIMLNAPSVEEDIDPGKSLTSASQTNLTDRAGNHDIATAESQKITAQEDVYGIFE